MPKARPRSRGSVKVVVSRESTDGASRAPNVPCRARAPISMPVVCDAPAEGRGGGEADDPDR